MKNYISILSFLLLVIVTNDLIAQTPIRRPRSTPQRDRIDQREKPPMSDFRSRLWYGGNINLGFQGNNFESIFLFGLAPMVGYKVTPEFSIGPRVELIYSYYKLSAGPQILRYNLFSGGIGPFARYKFFKMLFFHLEYQLEFAQFPSPLFDGTKNTQFFNNTFVGLGYNAGGGEILLLYNLNNQAIRNTLEMPISLRFGFTINF